METSYPPKETSRSAMTKNTQVFSLVAILVVATSMVAVLSSRADDNAGDAAVKTSPTYRPMFRHEIDQLGGHEKDTLLRINSTEALEAGLNKLSADGWELVAVEGGRTVPLSGPHEPKAVYPPVYIFRRSGD